MNPAPDIRDLVELHSSLGREVLSHTDTDGALGAVTRVAAVSVPGADYASITRRRHDAFQTLGPTEPGASLNDALQYDAGEGPAVDAVTHGTVVVVDDLATDARYPDFGPRAVAATGVRSMLSIGLVLDDGDDVRAGLTVYSLTPAAFDDTAQTIGMLLASHGAVAVSGVIARERATNLEKALGNSRRIGMAIGVLMASTKVTADEAFTLLRIASQNGNRKLVDVAAEVTATGTIEFGSERRGRP